MLLLTYLVSVFVWLQALRLSTLKEIEHQYCSSVTGILCGTVICLATLLRKKITRKCCNPCSFSLTLMLQHFTYYCSIRLQLKLMFYICWCWLYLFYFI